MNPNAMCDDDIEEGEIVDSDSIETDVNIPSSSKTRKSLPRRYVIANNKLHSKTKRKCKHSHHHMKKEKLKKTPMKSKNHKKKICLKHSPLNNSVAKAILSKSSLLNVKNPENYSNSFISEISSSLKVLKAYDKKVDNSLLHKSITKFTPVKVAESLKFPSRFDKFKKGVCFESKNNSNSNPNLSIQNGFLVSADEAIVNESDRLVSTSDLPPSIKSESKKEDSEDEDELRRIALATCTKKSEAEELVEEKVEIKLCIDNQTDALFSPQGTVKPVTDNYEIVDMELDDNVCPVEAAEDLFVIDTKPSMPGEFNQDCSLETSDKITSSSNPLDDEFEEEFLRAVLLAGMSSQKRKDNDEIVEPELEQENDKAVEKCSSKPEQIKTPPLPTPSLPSHGSAPLTLPMKKINAKTKQPLKAQPSNTQKSPERIIISLNDESSSDESDAEVENNGPNSTSCVSSLEALICDARKKSDQPKPDTNVSYLSKAQQEEYNLYKKILNANGSEQALIHKNKFSPLPRYELKLKEKKLSIALSNYTKEKNLMTNETRAVLKKRAEFMKVKLKTQQLKEELLESRKMMKNNLLIYQKSLNHLKTIKKSVMKREELISNLKIECTNLGVSIEGKNYVLPTISNPTTPSLVDKTNSR